MVHLRGSFGGGVAFLALIGCTDRPEAPADPVFADQDPAVAEDLANSWMSAEIPDAELDIGRVEFDRLGMAHVRANQTLDGVPVFGAQGIVHLAADGTVASFSDSVARGLDVDTHPTLTGSDAETIARRIHAGSVDAITTDLQVVRHDGADALVWRVRIDDLADGTPSRPVLFVDAHTGALVWRYDDLRTVEDRMVYSAKHKSILPGTLRRAEGSAAIGDQPVDDAYDHSGSTWEYYDFEQGRDAWDGLGSSMTASAHYSVAYDNAFWDGTQVAFGDGGALFLPLSQSLDVVGHEFTHGVTQATSDLIYSGESGGLNEGSSDIMGATIQSFTNGWLVDETTWQLGEDIALPVLGDALRYMDDPPLDGASIDNYADYSSSLDVHYTSGIANKAFYLMSTDPELGIEGAADVWYRALTSYMTPSETFLDARIHTVTAATDLYGSASNEVTAVKAAWDGVGVYEFVLLSSQTIQGLKGTNTTFTFETPAGATALKFATSGGTGNVDLYVKFGANPTKAINDCEDTGTGNTETCVIANPQVGTYFVSVSGILKYKNVVLRADWAGTAPEVCGDTLDNDADGAIDCADPGCDADATCVEVCDDAVDNDGDGQLDCADGACDADAVCAAP